MIIFIYDIWTLLLTWNLSCGVCDSPFILDSSIEYFVFLHGFEKYKSIALSVLNSDFFRSSYTNDLLVCDTKKWLFNLY